jgi:hypothetical protein
MIRGEQYLGIASPFFICQRLAAGCLFICPLPVPKEVILFGLNPVTE